MRYHIVFLLAATLLVPPLAFAQQQRQQPSLGKRVESLLEHKIVPAYQLGDRLQLIQSLSDATSRMKPEQLEAFDDRLLNFGMPNSAELMLAGYMSLLTQGQTKDLPKPAFHDALAMLPQLESKIKDVVGAVDDSVATIEPLPKLETLEEYEGLFWEIHVLKNKLENAARYAEFGTQLVEKAQKKRRVSDENAGKLAEFNDFKAYSTRLKSAYQDLEERQLEFRLDRMALAKQVLSDTDKYLGKLQATFGAQQDIQTFRNLFASRENGDDNARQTFARARLKDGQLAANVEDMAKQLDALSHDYKRQAELLFRGIHWWMRGRYGRGPEQNGLLKNVQVVTNDGLLFPLFIPENMQKPPFELVRNPAWGVSDENGNTADDVKPYVAMKSEDGIKPDYARRHHHGWMFEYRRGFRSVNSSSQLVDSITTDTMKTKSEGKEVFFF